MSNSAFGRLAKRACTGPALISLATPIATACTSVFGSMIASGASLERLEGDLAEAGSGACACMAAYLRVVRHARTSA